MLKDIAKLLESLVKNNLLALMIVGVALIIVGGAGVIVGGSGDIPIIHSNVIETGWRITIGAFGVVVAAAGIFVIIASLPRGPGSGPADKYDFKECKFRISNVVDEGIVQLHELKNTDDEKLHDSEKENVERKNYYDLNGKYSKKPPQGYLVAIINIDGSGNYRIRQGVNTFEKEGEEGGTWEATDIYVNQPGLIYVQVAYVGPSGKALWDYYDKVRRFRGPNEAPAISALTSDIHRDDASRIRVNAQRVGNGAVLGQAGERVSSPPR